MASVNDVEKFNGLNYSTWRIGLTSLLLTHNAYRVLSGALSRPNVPLPPSIHTNTPERRAHYLIAMETFAAKDEEFRRIDNMALGLMFLTMEPQMAEFILKGRPVEDTDPRGLWEKMELTYGGQAEENLTAVATPGRRLSSDEDDMDVKDER